MLVLLAIPVITIVALAHRYLQAYAPSNILVGHLRSRRPSIGTAMGLLAITSSLLLAMHLLAEAIAAGGAKWLQLLVLVLAWDAIKLAVLSILMLGRGLGRLLLGEPVDTHSARLV